MHELIRFQTDRGLDKQECKGINEAANIVEELVESIGFKVPKENRPKLKVAVEEFFVDLVKTNIANPGGCAITTKAEKVDAYCDIITFATGAILKLGYDPIKAVEECGKEINSRVGGMVDGKFEKDLSPEAQANWYKADYTKAVKDEN